LSVWWELVRSPEGKQSLVTSRQSGGN
jgi:hypothetical protein